METIRIVRITEETLPVARTMDPFVTLDPYEGDFILKGEITEHAWYVDPKRLARYYPEADPTKTDQTITV